MGDVPAKSRRADAGQAAGCRAGGGVRRLRPGSGHAAVRPGLAPAASRRCWGATNGGCGWPTACSSRFPARRRCSMARRSGWARTSPSRTAWPSAPRCSGPMARPRILHGPTRCVVPAAADRRAVRAGRRERRRPAHGSGVAAELVRAHDPPAQGATGDRLGPCTVLDGGDRSALVLRYDWDGDTIVTAHNLARAGPPRRCPSLASATGRSFTTCASRAARCVRNGVARIPLRAYDHRWFRLVPPQ